MKKNSVTWIIITVVLAVILAIAAYFIFRQHKEMEEFKTRVEMEKERLLRESMQTWLSSMISMKEENY